MDLHLTPQGLALGPYNIQKKQSLPPQLLLHSHLRAQTVPGPELPGGSSERLAKFSTAQHQRPTFTLQASGVTWYERASKDHRQGHCEPLNATPALQVDWFPVAPGDT